MLFLTDVSWLNQQHPPASFGCKPSVPPLKNHRGSKWLHDAPVDLVMLQKEGGGSLWGNDGNMGNIN